MKRLTKMDRRGFYTNKATCRNIFESDGDWFKGVYFRSHFLAIDGEPIEKLGKLEDIEKELGISLIKLFKALKGIWVKSTNGDVYYVENPYLCFSENEKGELELQFKVGDAWYKIKDYRKTWALGKKMFVKELEND